MEIMSKSEMRLRANLRKYPDMDRFEDATVHWLQNDQQMDELSDYIEKEHPDFYAIFRKASDITE